MALIVVASGKMLSGPTYLSLDLSLDRPSSSPPAAGDAAQAMREKVLAVARVEQLSGYTIEREER